MCPRRHRPQVPPSRSLGPVSPHDRLEACRKTSQVVAPGACRLPGLLMRVALTADPGIPVPPQHYGGIERIVDLLAKGLVAAGHDVTLFAHRDSRVPCPMRPYRASPSGSITELLWNVWHITSAVATGRFDVLHSFSRLAYMAP